MRSKTKPQRWSKHRHKYKFMRRHQHPEGYLFWCEGCFIRGLEPYKFIRIEKFWIK